MIDDVQKAIAEACDEVKEMLLAKNREYGNSALDPVRIFARDVAPDVQLAVRIDDKLSRIARGQGGNEDAELDLLGYLILRRVYKKQHPEQWLASAREVRPQIHITIPAGLDSAVVEAAVDSVLKRQQYMETPVVRYTADLEHVRVVTTEDVLGASVYEESAGERGTPR